MLRALSLASLSLRSTATYSHDLLSVFTAAEKNAVSGLATVKLGPLEVRLSRYARFLTKDGTQEVEHFTFTESCSPRNLRPRQERPLHLFHGLANSTSAYS